LDTGIDVKQVVAFGDAENDLEMLQLAGSGFAAQNATPGLKKEFKNISQHTNDQNFVTLELTKIFKEELSGLT